MNNNLTLGELIEKLIELETDPRCMRTTPTNIVEIQIQNGSCIGAMRNIKLLELEHNTPRMEILLDEIADLKAQLVKANKDLLFALNRTYPASQ